MSSKIIFAFLLFFISSLTVIVAAESFVTVEEYANFLNAVASGDPHMLYHETMSEIVRTGDSGNYHYEVVDGSENLPITFITWLDAARYCNWKEHDSPTRDLVTLEVTETGSYALNGAMSGSITKNEGAHYFLPTRKENIPSSLLANTTLHFWGAQCEISDKNVPIPIFYNPAPILSDQPSRLPRYDSDEISGLADPSLAANDLGFYVVEEDRRDQFNAANFLQVSHPDEGDGTWSVFNEVIGVVGVLTLMGGARYAYYRSHAVPERSEPLTQEEQEERTAELAAADRDRAEREREEEMSSARERVDVVTGKAENSEHFTQDQRSYLKQWADWLRNRNHLDSVYEGADDIEGIDDSLFIDSGSWIEPEQRTWAQKIVYWMTQSFYLYKNTATFLSLKGKHQQALQQALETAHASIVQHKEELLNHPAIVKTAQHLVTIREPDSTTIEGYKKSIQEYHEVIAGCLETINQHAAKIQLLENADKSEVEARRQRLANNQQLKQKKDIVEGVLKQAIQVEKSLVFPQQLAFECPTMIPSPVTRTSLVIADAKETPEKPLSESSIASSAESRGLRDIPDSALKGIAIPPTPLRKLLEVTRDYLIVKFSWLEQVAHALPTEEQEYSVSNNIKRQLGEMWRAYLHLVEGRQTLASKKNLLWGNLATLGSVRSDYIPDERVSQIHHSIISIQSKVGALPQSLEIYHQKVNSFFIQVQREFEEDTKSTASRDSAARKSLTGIPNSGEQTLKKKKSWLSKIFRPLASSSSSELKDQKMTENELQATTACLELEARVKKAFSEKVLPIIYDLEGLHADTYQYLHLVEESVMDAHDAMKLYEADQNKVLIVTSSLMENLKKRLLDAREKSKTVTDILSQVEGTLGGSWQAAKTEAGVLTYVYQRGGWGEISREEDLNKAVNLFTGYKNQLGQISFEQLRQAIQEAEAMAKLVRTAKEKADQFLVSQEDIADVAKTAFLEVMEPLIHFSGMTTSLPEQLTRDHEHHLNDENEEGNGK